MFFMYCYDVKHGEVNDVKMFSESQNPGLQPALNISFAKFPLLAPGSLF